jgi:hypothetical protein
VGVVVLVGGFFAAYKLSPGRVDAESLNHSVFRELDRGGSWDEKKCAEREQDLWFCPIGGRAKGGERRYRTVMDGNCWEARLATGTERGALPARLEGCVKLEDNLRILE